MVVVMVVRVAMAMEAIIVVMVGMVMVMVMVVVMVMVIVVILVVTVVVMVIVVVVVVMMMVTRLARFGMKEWGNSKLVPFNHKIRVDNEVAQFLSETFVGANPCCLQTGEYYELGRLAPRRYREVMGETRVIQVGGLDITMGIAISTIITILPQLGMMKGFGKDPKDKEVEVLYQG